jgi:radical SAM protein with 4Fe4S-binding SPASM domain
MEKDLIYILNPEYDLRADNNRIIITNRRTDPTINDFIGFVHPVYAIILSFFDGEKNLVQVMESVAALLRKDQAVISKIVEPLLENEEGLHFHYDGYHFSFPEKILIRRDDGIIPKKYNPEDFFIPKQEMDLESRRLHYPLDILFMVNTRCVTDCIYCYADRIKNIDCRIPPERLMGIIREAKELDMRSFDITGGELFLYSHWEDLLAELIANGYAPYISTKCPISTETIRKLKDVGINRIQISIDSIIKEELTKILNVKEDYYYQLLDALKNIDENGFDIYTNTQFTSINTGHYEELIDYLLNLENIKRINMGAAGFSLYKSEENYRRYKPALKEIKKIEAYVNELKEKYAGKININFSGYADKDSIINKAPEDKKKNFKDRSRCSGNFYAFFILPDGKVTICEELYWHPAFIIGDLTKQSIKEVWNSKRALELYNISKDMVRDESPCKKCDEFEPCHKYQGVCWKEVLYAYGRDNWDYADPRCPYAGKPKREYYI